MSLHPLVAGADGCGAGWLAVFRDLETGDMSSGLFLTACALLDHEPCPAVLGVDIPIGLSERNGRACETEARRLLGKRRSSVFNPPVRGLLLLVGTATHVEATAHHREIDGRGISVQGWNIAPKIKEWDDLLSADPVLQNRVREVHPEVAFTMWAGRPMEYSKKTREGRAERRELVEGHFGADAVGQVRERYPVGQVAHDDILDAFAVLWTAERIFRGEARTLPAEPPVDTSGLRMEIVV